MERGRLACIGAPKRTLAMACTLCIGAALSLSALLGGVVATGGAASARASGTSFNPGGPGPSGPAAAAAAATEDVAVQPTPCDAAGRETDRTGINRHRFVVTAAYCTILRRAPDAGGLRYWTEQMDDGLSPFQLVQILVGSAEFQARQARAFNDSLSAITLGQARAEELQDRQLQAAIVADAELQAEEVRESPQEWAAVDPQRLRVRTAIAGEAFNAHIAGVDLAATDVITDALVHGTLPGDRQPVNVAYVHLSQTQGMRVSPGGRGRATVGTWAAEIGAHVAINGNWYAPYDGPAVSAGAVYGGDDHFYTAVFGFTESGDAIIEHHRATNDGVDARIVEAVSGHPTLIHRGERTTDFGGDPTFTSRQPRTAIGLDETGDILILVTVDGRSTVARGMTGDETAQLMERLGAHDAVMLDGGGSSTMWIAGRGIVNRPSGSLRAVGNQIAVFGE